MCNARKQVGGVKTSNLRLSLGLSRERKMTVLWGIHPFHGRLRQKLLHDPDGVGSLVRLFRPIGFESSHRILNHGKLIGIRLGSAERLQHHHAAA